MKYPSLPDPTVLISPKITTYVGGLNDYFSNHDVVAWIEVGYT